MVFGYPLYALAAALVFLMLPGMMLTRLLARDKFRNGWFAVAFAVGCMVVPYLSLLLTGLLGLAVKIHISLVLVGALSLFLTASAALGIRLVEGSFGFVGQLWSRMRDAFSWPLFLYLGLVFVLYLVSYDSTLFDQERCVSRAGILPYFDYLTGRRPVGFPGCIDCFSDRNAFFLWNGGQRMGPSVFVANFMALFGFPGFRILHATFGLLTGWFGFHLGNRVFGRPLAGLLVSVLLALNPWALSIPLLDENIMGLALGTVLFFFLLEKPTEWLFAGVTFGLFLGIRHVGILSIPALVVAAALSSSKDHYRWPGLDRWVGTGRWVNVAITGVATALFSIPWIFIHTMAYIRGRELYESFVSMHPYPHSILGIDFPFQGLLSWPFLDAPVRSPYNGFPTLVSFPLAMLRTWGTAMVALVPLGLVWKFKRHKGLFVVGALWALPQFAMLMVMANWVQPNKMGVFLCFSQPVVLAIVGGVIALWEALVGREDLAGWTLSIPGALSTAAVTLVLLLAGQWAVADYEAPLDHRNFGARVEYILNDYPVTPPMMVTTEADYAALDRRRLARITLGPDWSLPPHLSDGRLLGARLADMADDCAKPLFGDYGERPKDIMHSLSGIPNPDLDFRGDTRKTVTFADMMHHPVSHLRDDMGGDWGRDMKQSPDVSQWVDVDFDFQLPVSRNPHFLDIRGEGGNATYTPVGFKVLVAPDLPVDWSGGNRCHFVVVPVSPGQYWVTLWFGDYTFDHLRDRDDVQFITPRESVPHIHLSFPDGSLIRFNEVTSLEPTRFHVWTAHVDEGEVTVDGPVPSSY